MKIYQVDAFTNGAFTGNPAAVVPLTSWLAKDVMQKIAMENNLSETAFCLPSGDGYDLRWFTPSHEVQLCGHATFATAYVIFNKSDYNDDTVTFNTLSGALHVRKLEEDLMEMNLPTDDLRTIELSDDILDAVGGAPTKVLEGREDYMLVYSNEEDIGALKPDFSALKKVGVRGIIATAPGQTVDFVSRCFYPGVGIDEDPGTGSAHTSLAPYWANRLGRNVLEAKQISSRGSYFDVEYLGERTLLRGRARLYMEGQLFV